MLLAMNQPYFFPYIGYWQLIKSADVFVLMDDCQFINKGWVNRNRILVNGKPSFFRVEADHLDVRKNINDIRILPVNIEGKKNQLFAAYRKAPYFNETMDLINDVLTFEDLNLASFLENSIRKVCSYLEIDTKIVRSSDYEGNSSLKSQERIYDMCNHLGADSYVNAIGGTTLYSFEEFKKRGIELKFINPKITPYKQFDNEFVSHLSIIDMLMFMPKEDVIKSLDNYTFVTGETHE